MNQTLQPYFSTDSIKTYPIKTNMPPRPTGYPISATIVKDSISPDWKRITTLELVFPRYILAEFNTHRAFSRNASSSRAIPTNKLISNSSEMFVEPVRYGKNKAGMQADAQNLSGEELEEARAVWKEMAEVCKRGCAKLAKLGLHKQWASRPLEWFSTIKVVLTATEFENFFWLRDHSEAQDEICYLTQDIKIALNASTPILIPYNGWHLPYVSEEDLKELGLENALKVSAARCARVSYKTVHGIKSTLQEDLDLFNRLVHDLDDPENPFHASPTEHQAKPGILLASGPGPLQGNFSGWEQHRKYIELRIPISN